MRFIRTARTTAIAAAAVALVATTALSASADLGSPTDSDDIVGVGSDTTEHVLNDLAKAYNGTTPTPTRRLASFDATGSSPIAIRPTVSIPRPNGSGAGITALSGSSDLDFARSSRAPQAGDAANLAFLTFAKDRLRWMANEDVTGVTSLSDAQLTSIYNCNTTNWSQLGGPNLAITPLVPQVNSGTRAAWAERVGIDPVNLPSCVSDTYSGGSVQEHDPAPVIATAGSIAPVSQGRYQQLNPEPAGAFLGAIPSPDSDGYDRDVYNVVKTDANGEVPAYLADVFGNGTGDGTGWICSTEAQDIIEAAGFTRTDDLFTCGLAAPR